MPVWTCADCWLDLTSPDSRVLHLFSISTVTIFFFGCTCSFPLGIRILHWRIFLFQKFWKKLCNLSFLLTFMIHALVVTFLSPSCGHFFCAKLWPIHPDKMLRVGLCSTVCSAEICEQWNSSVRVKWRLKKNWSFVWNLLGVPFGLIQRTNTQQYVTHSVQQRIFQAVSESHLLCLHCVPAPW